MTDSETGSTGFWQIVGFIPELRLREVLEAAWNNASISSIAEVGEASNKADCDCILVSNLIEVREASPGSNGAARGHSCALTKNFQFSAAVG